MSNLVVNGGFETGTFSGWTQTSTGALATNISTATVSFGIHPPHTGTYSACLICSDSGTLGPTRALFQDIAVPAAGAIQLTFWYGLTHAFSRGLAKCDICDLSNNVLANVFSQNSATLQSPVWTQATADLSAFAGQTVRLRFNLTTTVAAVGNVFFSLDDIQALYTANPPVPIPPAPTTIGTTRTRFTLRGPNNIFWQLGADSTGAIIQVSINNVNLKDFDDMILQELKGRYFKFTADVNGAITYTTTTSADDINRAIQYIPFVNSDGVYLKMRVVNGLIRMFETEELLDDSIPTPLGTTISHMGSAERLIHDSCGLATVTPRGDFGLWCGSCNKYVLPEHANFLVILEE